jgi:hypothetical protein
MDSTNNITNSLLQSSDSTFPSTSYSTSESSNGFFDNLKSVNMTTWLLIILILAFLGFNIFAYLAKGTQDIADVFAPITKMIFGTAVGVTGEVVDVSAEGAKAVVSGTAGALNTGLTAVQDITPNVASSSVKGQPVSQQQVDNIQQSTLNRALNTAQSQQPQQKDYEAHDASSTLKSGWCYIGDDRGFRSCAQVGVNDTCMSGDIFPSQEICMNPNLRA